jgi:hypothetical protein
MNLVIRRRLAQVAAALALGLILPSTASAGCYTYTVSVGHYFLGFLIYTSEETRTVCNDNGGGSGAGGGPPIIINET